MLLNWRRLESTDLLWSKPENKQQAGKLLIIGGNTHEFAAPGEAYTEAVKAGVGTAKVLLPSSLQKTLGSVLENGEFAPSNKSGSFSKQAISEWLSFGSWADGVLIAGDLGRNSETAVVLESFVEKYPGLLTITKDAVDYFSHQPLKLLNRPDTAIVLSLAQLQKLCSGAKWLTAITYSMTLQQLVEVLHDLSQAYSCSIITEHNGVIFVAVNGKVSTTKVEENDTWRVQTAANVSVWWLQNPSKPFEALTTAQNVNIWLLGLIMLYFMHELICFFSRQ